MARHGYIRLTDRHIGGQRIHTDPIRHLNQIATCKGRGPLEFAHNLEGWLRVAHALTQIAEAAEVRGSSSSEQARPQLPPDITPHGRRNGQSTRQTGNVVFKHT